MLFPLNFWDISLWLAVTAMILLTTAELIPASDSQKTFFLSKKKLEKAALTMGILFLMTTVLRIFDII